MGFSVDLSAFEQNQFDDFWGTYAKDVRQARPEKLIWLTNNDTQAAVTDNYQAPDVMTVYDTGKLASEIPYDVFLSAQHPWSPLQIQRLRPIANWLFFVTLFIEPCAPFVWSVCQNYFAGFAIWPRA